MSGRRAWLAPLLVVLAVIAVYAAPASRAEYAQDDAPAFLHHPAVQWPIDWPAIAHARYFGDAEHDYDPLTRPLVTLSYALEQGAGLAASPARHWTNLLLYALVCAWWTWLVQRLLQMWHRPQAAQPTALVAGLWFALHPAHAEVVMQVAYRPELMAAVWQLLAFESLLAWRQAPRPLWLPVGALALAAALWSKEQSAMLLPLAYLWALARPGLWRRFLPLLATWTLVVIAWLVWRRWLLGPLTVVPVSAAINPLVATSAAVRLWTALAIVWRAVQHLLWPVDLAPDYGMNAWPPLAQPELETLVGTLVLLGLIASALWLAWRARQKPLAADNQMLPRELGLLALVWAMLTWLPVSNLLFPSTTLFGDRLLFAPSAALCFGLPVAVALWAPSWQPIQRRLRFPVLATFGVVTLAVCLHETPAIAAAWTNELALYTRGVALQPNSMRMNHNLAYTLSQRGQLAEAAVFQRAALRIRPTDLDALALGLELARKQHRCEDGVALARTLAQVPKAAVQARRIALDWAMACQAWQEGWLAVRLLPPQKLTSRQALDVFALAVAANQEREALAWAQPIAPQPWQSPPWVSAGVFGAEAGGRPLAALQHLTELAKAQPQLPGLDTAARDLYQRHAEHADAAAMRALVQATWPSKE